MSTCPRCGASIPSADINVAADTALCRRCESALRFSDLVHGPAADLARPPRGVIFEQTLDGFRVTATTRSPIAFILLPFMVVWSGGALGMIYGTQLWTGHFNLLNSLFGIPFLLGTAGFGGYALMTAAGRVVLVKRGDDGLIFEGIGPIGWTRRFSWSSVAGACVEDAPYLGRGRRQSLIRIDLRANAETRPLRFGTLLSAERREFLLAVLHRR